MVRLQRGSKSDCEMPRGLKMTVWVKLAEWVVPNVHVQIQCLRIGQIGVWNGLRSCAPIRARPPTLRTRKVPCSEIIQTRFRITFLAGKACAEACRSHNRANRNHNYLLPAAPRF